MLVTRVLQNWSYKILQDESYNFLVTGVLQDFLLYDKVLQEESYKTPVIKIL